jgi:hypothetical protein
MAAEATLTMAVDYVGLGRMDDARQTLARFDASDGANHLTPLSRARWLWARSWVGTGDLALKESLALLGDAQAAMGPLPLPGPPEVDLLRDRVAFDIGQTHLMLGDYATGEARLRELLSRQVARHGKDLDQPVEQPHGSTGRRRPPLPCSWPSTTSALASLMLRRMPAPWAPVRRTCHWPSAAGDHAALEFGAPGPLADGAWCARRSTGSGSGVAPASCSSASRAKA